MNIPLLLRLREAAGSYLPPAELGEPARVEADLADLEAFGFALERHPLLGVAYRGPSDRLCPDLIEHGLSPRTIGRRVAVWSRVGSTNDLAAAAAGSIANEGLVILAEEQTAGRGRRGRSWTAPRGTSLLLSTLVFPFGSLGDPAWLTALAAVATAEVVERWSGRRAGIKWPNDVRVGGRKVAGILVERGAGAVIGIGMNVNVFEADLPPDLAATATSLGRLAGGRLDRSEVARDLIQRLDEAYTRVVADGAGPLVEPWRSRLEPLGATVRVETRSGTVVGQLLDADFRTGLVVVPPGRPAEHVAACDVVALAPIGGGSAP